MRGPLSRYCLAGARFCWRLLPSRIRSRLMIEGLRRLVPKAENIPADGTAPLYVLGFFSAPTGLGQSARLFLQEMRHSYPQAYAVDLSFMLRSTPTAGLHEEACLPLENLADHAGPGTVAVHANPPGYMAALLATRKLLPGKRRIACWVWELEDIPPAWTRCFDYLDEVITPSSFVTEAVRKHTEKPVRTRPYAVPPPPALQKPAVRPFTVLSCFDLGSNYYRKNPLAAMEAFKLAFPDGSNARLLLKVSGVEKQPREWLTLLESVDASTVRFCLARLSQEEMDALYAECDVYLSLHRSEGYGLTIQEAMLHGLPVVATGWSGNMDFMRGEDCYPVPYTLTPVGDPQGSYHVAGALWADPDIRAAADILRKLHEQFVQGRTQPEYLYA